MADIFLFNGGPYARGVEDGRVRDALDCVEAQQVFRDPELPGAGINNASTGILHMQRYPELSALAVNDRIYIAVLPDVMLYKGLWALPQTAYAGLEVAMDLVSACEVATVVEASGDLGTVATSIGDSMLIDFGVALGDATKDACDKAAMMGEPFSDFRNTEAFQTALFAMPDIAGLGEAQYIRLTIIAVPATPPVDDCNACGSGEAHLPMLQYGAIYDDIGVNKQIIATTQCRDTICAGDC